MCIISIQDCVLVSIAVLIMGTTAEFYEHGINAWFACIGTAVFLPLGIRMFTDKIYGLGFTSSYTVFSIYI